MHRFYNVTIVSSRISCKPFTSLETAESRKEAIEKACARHMIATPEIDQQTIVKCDVQRD